MALLVCLLVVVVLSAATYLIFVKSLWKRQTVFLDAEQAVAVETPEPRASDLEKEKTDSSSPASWSPIYERDARAADSQLLTEFAAVAESNYALCGNTMKLQNEGAEPVLYLNAKQFDRIMKRRAARTKLVGTLRLAKTSTKRRSLRKSDAVGGMVMGVS